MGDLAKTFATISFAFPDLRELVLMGLTRDPFMVWEHEENVNLEFVPLSDLSFSILARCIEKLKSTITSLYIYGIATTNLWRKFALLCESADKCSALYLEAHRCGFISVDQQNCVVGFEVISFDSNNEPCNICHSFWAEANHLMPEAQCPTCKNCFHVQCLLEWYIYTGKNNCTICQNDGNWQKRK